MKIQLLAPIEGPRTLKPCPSCRSRKKLQSNGIETSVRTNPTLLFSILRFQFDAKHHAVENLIKYWISSFELISKRSKKSLSRAITRNSNFSSVAKRIHMLPQGGGAFGAPPGGSLHTLATEKFEIRVIALSRFLDVLDLGSKPELEKRCMLQPYLCCLF